MDILVASQPSASTQRRLPAQKFTLLIMVEPFVLGVAKTTTDPLLPTPLLYVPPAFQPSQSMASPPDQQGEEWDYDEILKIRTKSVRALDNPVNLKSH
jgi:hypothetical protein